MLTVFCVFAVAGELNKHSLFDVFILSENRNEIMTIHGLRVQPDYSTGNAPRIDILVIPGGDGTKAVIRNQALPDWVRQVEKLHGARVKEQTMKYLEYPR